MTVWGREMFQTLSKYLMDVKYICAHMQFPTFHLICPICAGQVETKTAELTTTLLSFVGHHRGVAKIQT